MKSPSLINKSCYIILIMFNTDVYIIYMYMTVLLNFNQMQKPSCGGGGGGRGVGICSGRTYFIVICISDYGF